MPKKDLKIRSAILEWLRLIDNANERYYIPKALEIFQDISLRHQKGLLLYIVEQMPSDKWESGIESEDYWDTMKVILWYYSGREALGEPTRKHFRALLITYSKSKYFREAETKKPKKSFREMLEEEE